MSGLAWEVMREVPNEYIAGLLSGVYQLHGGVLRDGAGRIVAHLAAPSMEAATSMVTSLVPGLNVISDLITQGQLFALGRSVEQVRQSMETVLTVSVAGAAMSGLGLVTSLGGFSYLSHRLGKLDAKLAEVQNRLKRIEDLIRSQQKAQLNEAIDTLRQVDQLPLDSSLRHDLLLHAKKSFGTLAHFYRDVLKDAKLLEEVDGADELYALSFTGLAYSASELGMGKAAASAVGEHLKSWLELVRSHAMRQLAGDGLGRWQDEALVECLPAAELVELLDFSHGTQKGVAWFDDIRLASASVLRDPRKQARTEKELPRIGAARRLRARHQVLSATAAHFDMLSELDLTVSDFGRHVKDASAQSDTGAVVLRVIDSR